MGKELHNAGLPLMQLCYNNAETGLGKDTGILLTNKAPLEDRSSGKIYEETGWRRSAGDFYWANQLVELK
jgi:hypothetical protein